MNEFDWHEVLISHQQNTFEMWNGEEAYCYRLKIRVVCRAKVTAIKLISNNTKIERKAVKGRLRREVMISEQQ